MKKTMSSVWAFLPIALVTVAGLGCATGTSGTAMAATDLASLAGMWSGSITTPAGRPVPGTLELAPSGDYVARAGSFSAQGKAQVKDGKVMLTSTSTAGGMATGQRTSTANLSKRADGALVLTGNGHADAGPFSFEVVRQK
ncbi:MAG: hypothetical protein ACREK6_13675 [Candidatus Rokuibacteriota bacterium]